MSNHLHERFLALFQRMEGLELGQAPLKQIKLSLPQVALLGCVTRNPGSHAQDVAETMGLTAPTVSVGLRKLEEEGWLRREPDPEDGRAVRHFPTQKALGVLRSMQSFRRKKMEEFLMGLDEDEQTQLISLLDKALSHLENKTTR